MQEKPLVGIVMGSQSDWPILCESAKTLKDLKISFEAEIVSAHRTPVDGYQYPLQDGAGIEQARGYNLSF